MEKADTILGAVRRYYGDKIVHHGRTPAGVDWNSAESQSLRFRQLLRVCDFSSPVSILDYGCGYGALLEFLDEGGLSAEYRGFDIAPEMLAAARNANAGRPLCVFSDSVSELAPVDYTVASGVFNVKLGVGIEEWAAYVKKTLTTIAGVSRRGFAFNMLTSYSDPARMRPDLYYGDPTFFFDHCKRAYSRNVALLHDYELFEFTILVRI